MMKEENEKYRKVISSTLEFNPEILKRYVNFMSNPDEETAIRQFGTDDKYFGVATLMVTLPGLPMFAHGQVEGYSEKYGMEYKKAYYNEFINEYLVDRHRREIFPLMKKRYMFSQVNDFWFYDFFTSDGSVNQNVFAYSNRFGDERAIVVYNNKFSETTGWINRTTGKSISTGMGEERATIFSSLVPALGLRADDRYFYIYRDLVANLEYIRIGRELAEKGMFIHLKPFKYHVFLDFREVYDMNGDYEAIWKTLSGRGVRSIEEALIDLRMSSVHESLLNLFDNKAIELVSDLFIKDKEIKDTESTFKILINGYEFFITQVMEHIKTDGSMPRLISNFRNGLNAVKSVNDLLLDNEIIVENDSITNDFRKSLLLSKESNYPGNLLIYALWLSLKDIGTLRQKDDTGTRTIELFDELYLTKPLQQILHRLGRSGAEIDQVIKLIRVLLKNKAGMAKKPEEKPVVSKKKGAKASAVVSKNGIVKEEKELLEKLLGDEEVKSYIGVNYFEGEWYYSKENLEELGNWRLTLRIMNYLCEGGDISEKNTALFNYIRDSYHMNRFLKEISDSSEYKLNNLKANLTSVTV